MSVIGNALKAAQKEKQRRTAGGGGAPPLIVPLKGRAASGGFNWTRVVVLAVGGAAIFGITAVSVKLMRGDLRALPAPQPVILGDAPATPPVSRDSAPRVASASPVATAPAPAVRKTASVPDTKRSASAPPATRAAATQQGTRDSAQPGLRIAIEPPREDAARLFAAAVAAHRAGDLNYARVAYERVLVMAPADVDAMNNLGILLSAQRELDRAERLLRRAAQLAPRNAGVWNNLGTVLRERGQSGDAIAAFQHALDIDPTHQTARVSLAQQYVAIGSLPKARELLEQVVAVNPGVAEAQYALGQVLEQQGDRAGAIRAYEAFVRVAPGRFATHVDAVKRRLDALRSP